MGSRDAASESVGFTNWPDFERFGRCGGLDEATPIESRAAIPNERRVFVTTSEAITEGIRVEVTARYAPEHAEPSRWFFLYTIRVSNEGQETVQLLSRHWVIRDATGQIEEVRGPGVVGEQPVIEPGGSYEYTSGCPLPTPFGSMEGTYQLVTESGVEFDAQIAEFMLREPGAIH
jgi:ApaG protein